MDNRGERGYAQRKDVSNREDNKVSNAIFSLFLKLANSKVILIIRLKPRTEKYLTYY